MVRRVCHVPVGGARAAGSRVGYVNEADGRLHSVRPSSTFDLVVYGFGNALERIRAARSMREYAEKVNNGARSLPRRSVVDGYDTYENRSRARRAWTRACGVARTRALSPIHFHRILGRYSLSHSDGRSTLLLSPPPSLPLYRIGGRKSPAAV